MNELIIIIYFAQLFYYVFSGKWTGKAGQAQPAVKGMDSSAVVISCSHIDYHVLHSFMPQSLNPMVCTSHILQYICFSDCISLQIL